MRSLSIETSPSKRQRNASNISIDDGLKTESGLVVI